MGYITHFLTPFRKGREEFRFNSAHLLRTRPCKIRSGPGMLYNMELHSQVSLVRSHMHTQTHTYKGEFPCPEEPTHVAKFD